MKINSKSTPRRAKLIIILSVVGVLLLGGAAYATYVIVNPAPKSTDSDTTKDTDTVNYDAPSSEQQQSGADIKDGTVNTPTTSDSSKTDAEVIITFADQVNSNVKIRSYMNALQNGGECVLTLTKGSDTITKKGTIQPSANISACAEFTIPVSEFNDNYGTWQFSLSYSGETKKGSASGSFEVTKP